MKLLCEDYAHRSMEFALEADNPELRRRWLIIATRWQELADMLPDQCVCTRRAIGFQHYKNGERRILCARNFHHALMRGVNVEFALTDN